MANLGLKDGIYHVRFRFQGKEYKKALKTRDKDDAEAAKRTVEQTIHRLLTGLLQFREDIDVGDLILSGGTLKEVVKEKSVVLPTTRTLADEYTQSQEHVLAPSYQYSQGVHLRHLLRYLGELADATCDQISRGELHRFLQ